MNDELAIRVLAHIEENPTQWKQRDWYQKSECGTAMCFAGWTTHLTGWQPQYGKIYEGGCEVQKAWVASRGDESREIALIAAKELGVERGEVGISGCLPGSLFYYGNTLDDLYRHVSELSGMDELVVRDKVAEERKRLQETKEAGR